MAEQEIELKKLTIVLAGRSFPVKVNKEEARILPLIEKDLNDQIRKMQLSYSDRDIQDCLSMVLLTQAISTQTKEPSIVTEISKKVDQLNVDLESVLT
ncbi:MAG: cell division protein ZapA [Saprospiraceae bacterium]|nr:cell division protein ZapA [Saprospiraceae bacterium]